MDFFFVRDARRRLRFYSAEPLGPLPAHFSRSRAVWEKAKRKVTSLNPRTLLQEQAFERGGRPPLRILHAGDSDAFLPGPNIVFYVLAIVMVVQWQALRGIDRILATEPDFVVDPLLSEWEAAVEARDEARFPELLERIERTHGLPSPRKLLWR
jgi:hypothetical protein